MGVDHCGFYIAVPEQFLNSAYILTAFQQVIAVPHGPRVAGEAEILDQQAHSLLTLPSR